MARAGYCSHGFFVGFHNEEARAEFVGDNGEKVSVVIPRPTCYKCELERTEAEEAAKRAREREVQSVKRAFLDLLKEDEAFLNEVKEILGVSNTGD